MTHAELKLLNAALSTKILVFQLLVDLPAAKAGASLLWSRTAQGFFLASNFTQVDAAPAQVKLVGVTEQPDAPKLPQLPTIDWATLHPEEPVATQHTANDTASEDDPKRLILAADIALRSSQSSGTAATPVAHTMWVDANDHCPDLHVSLRDDGLHDGHMLCRDPVFRQSLHEALNALGYKGPPLPRAELGMQALCTVVFEPTEEFTLWLHRHQGWAPRPDADADDEDADEEVPRLLQHPAGNAVSEATTAG